MRETLDRRHRERIPPQAAFLVRCWRERGADEWRFSLESVATRQRRGFDSLEALLDGLRASLSGLADGLSTDDSK